LRLQLEQVRARALPLAGGEIDAVELDELIRRDKRSARAR
jgi:hypothetical protein